jgi:RNA polymerase sigma factor (sigma-70 family)
MVAISTKNLNPRPNVDPRSLRYFPDRRNATKQAAENADRIAEWLERGGDIEPEPDSQALFAALHVCAYRAARRSGGRAIAPAEREMWANRWIIMRDHLVERNLGLVYSMMAKFGLRDLDHDELRSEAMFALVRAVEGFNPWRGFQFSTYACNAIVRALIHVARKTNRYRLRFPMEHESWHENVERVDPELELHGDRLHRALDENLGGLTDREALVIGWRYPMDGGMGLTLGEVGDAIGLSKERVRQIQRNALAKLRQVLSADPVLQ